LYIVVLHIHTIVQCTMLYYKYIVLYTVVL